MNPDWSIADADYYRIDSSIHSLEIKMRCSLVMSVGNRFFRYTKNNKYQNSIWDSSENIMVVSWYFDAPILSFSHIFKLRLNW